MPSELAILLADLKEREVLDAVKRRGEAEDAVKILEELREGLAIVGERYESHEYFLSEMIMAADLFSSAGRILKPKLQRQSETKMGKIVLGTVKGDIHTIGKDIVATLLESNGFTVYDVGIDVPPELFVEKVKEVGADILGMSTLLSTGVDPMKATVQALNEAGLRGRVKVMIGGNPVFGNPEAWMREVGADEYGKDAVDAVRKARRLMEG